MTLCTLGTRDTCEKSSIIHWHAALKTHVVSSVHFISLHSPLGTCCAHSEGSKAVKNAMAKGFIFKFRGLSEKPVIAKAQYTTGITSCVYLQVNHDDIVMKRRICPGFVRRSTTEKLEAVNIPRAWTATPAYNMHGGIIVPTG